MVHAGLASQRPGGQLMQNEPPVRGPMCLTARLLSLTRTMPAGRKGTLDFNALVL